MIRIVGHQQRNEQITKRSVPACSGKQRPTDYKRFGLVGRQQWNKQITKRYAPACSGNQRPQISNANESRPQKRTRERGTGTPKYLEEKRPPRLGTALISQSYLYPPEPSALPLIQPDAGTSLLVGYTPAI